MSTSVLYVLENYPQISQTYIHNELAALPSSWQARVIARYPADIATRDHLPFELVGEHDRRVDIVREHAPDVLHTHYLDELDIVGPLAAATDTPFTVRTHSFDVLGLRPKPPMTRLKRFARRLLKDPESLGRSRRALRWTRHELCLGVIGFPFARPVLEAAGVPPERIVECWPVVDVDRFLDRSPNGSAVMNVGAALDKKQMTDFVDLAAAVPDRAFTLYAMGYAVGELEAYARRHGSPVDIHPPVQPADMPAHYKKHRWLVYTGSFDLAEIGWPMAVAEAQASGVGVCVPAVRPDLADYVGDAGILYDDIRELTDVVAGPVPSEMREAGFEQAKRSDVREHISKLLELWEPAV